MGSLHETQTHNHPKYICRRFERSLVIPAMVVNFARRIRYSNNNLCLVIWKLVSLNALRYVAIVL